MTEKSADNGHNSQENNRDQAEDIDSPSSPLRSDITLKLPNYGKNGPTELQQAALLALRENLMKEYAESAVYVKWCASQVFVLSGLGLGVLSFWAKIIYDTFRTAQIDVRASIGVTLGAFICAVVLFFATAQVLRVNLYWRIAFQRSVEIESQIRQVFAALIPGVEQSNPPIITYATRSWNMMRRKDTNGKERHFGAVDQSLRRNAYGLDNRIMWWLLRFRKRYIFIVVVVVLATVLLGTTLLVAFPILKNTLLSS